MSDLNLKIISAGAGSGKTFRLTQEMAKTYIQEKGVRISGILATTFTAKAAAELQERVRAKLLEMNEFEKANELSNAMIGTVHSIGVKLLKRFAFEAGVSPEVDIISDEDQQVMFNNALATVLTNEHLRNMDRLVNKLGLNKSTKDYDWRKNVREITDVARGNDFDLAVLEKSKILSFQSFQPFLGEKITSSAADFKAQLIALIEDTILRVEDCGDTTATTKKEVDTIIAIKKELNTQGVIPWYQWSKLVKLKPAKKAIEAFVPLQEFAARHDTFSDFHQDIQDFIDTIFDVAASAMEEYQAYKRLRGLIDYTDMEILVKRLIEREDVQEVLRDELDLLMVDEFQDTNPIQLAIFFKLSQLAKYSVWVGDPKQSIYGFRGADPKLMKAIVEAQGGVKKENILEHSFRSRRELVLATNVIFDEAFPDIATPEVVLNPKRNEFSSFGTALKHWFFESEEGGKIPNKPYFDACIANMLKEYLEKGEYILPKGSDTLRLARPGDVAILCKSNNNCKDMAKALSDIGLKTAIAEGGLLLTAEARLLVACLKVMLDVNDALSVAEILVLSAEAQLGEIIEKRLDYLDQLGDNYDDNTWADDNAFIAKIKKLRRDAAEFSSSEILNLLIIELDLRRIIMSWSDAAQRIDNVDIIRKFALDYEDACKRLNSAASLGGFILWLNERTAQQKDQQASSQNQDAINIVTYHKSKGLEWPIVILHSLEEKLKDGVFGTNIISESEVIDLNDLLGNRWLRFWVNPYNDHSGKTKLEERISESVEKKRATRSALEEETRLMYVGITRSRDYLIFPTRKGAATLWLNRTWHSGNESLPTLDEESQRSPWSTISKEEAAKSGLSEADYLPIETIKKSYPQEFERSEIIKSKFDYFEPKIGKNNFIKYKIDLDNERFTDEFTVKNVTFHNYAAAFDLLLVNNPSAMIRTMQYYLLAKTDALSLEEQTQLLANTAQRLRWQQEDFSPFSQTYHDFFKYLQKDFSAKTLKKNQTLRYEVTESSSKHLGRFFQTKIDILIENDTEIIALKNDFYTGEKPKNKINDHYSWAYWVKKSMTFFHPAKKIRTVVHFALLGVVSEIVVE